MVFLLTVLGLYTRAMVSIIFVIEMLVFIKMIYPSLNQPIITLTANSTLLNSFLTNKSHEIKGNPYALITLILKTGIMIFAAITILWYAKQFFTSIGQIFNDWDTVVSWNNQALVWANNIFPRTGTGGRYPQLLPVNWSLTYVFTDSKVQFFAKPVMPLFSFYILLLMLDLAIRRKSPGYYASIILTGILIKTFLGEHITTGYADIPVAFFTFLSVYCLIESSNADSIDTKKKLLILGAFFAAGAAVTKQPGVLFAFLYPFLSAFLILKKAGDMTTSDKLKILMLILIIIGVIVLPWYVYKQINIMKGLESDEILANLNIDIGKTGIHAIVKKISFRYFFLMSILIAFSFFNVIYKWVTITFTLPIIFLWSFYFAYDVRNLAITIPLISSSIGISLENIFILTQSAFGKFKGSHIVDQEHAFMKDPHEITYNNSLSSQQTPLFRIKLCEAFIFLAIFMIIPSFYYNRPLLIERQIFLQKQIGTNNINKMVYDYQNDYGIDGKIMSNYQFLGHLPELEKFYEWEIFKNYETFDKHRKDPSIRYVLICTFPDWGVNQQIVEDINNMIRTGEYQLIDTFDNFVFFVKIR
jgi:hypothetical protein